MGKLCAYTMTSLKKNLLCTRRENAGVGGMIILVGILKKQAEGIYWIDLAPNREKRWAVQI
jgi:hypothetical protein